jgi:hypothetical protein
MNDQKKKGSVLLLTLIVTMLVLTSVVVLGTLIISSLKRSQFQATSFLAYYAAESVVEKSLYDYRRDTKTPNEIKTAITSYCTSGLGSNFPGLSADIKLYCNAVVEQKSQLSLGTIKRDKSSQVQVVNPDGVSKASGIASLSIQCTGSTTFMQVTRTLMLESLGGNQWGISPSETKKSFFSCPYPSTPFNVTLDQNSSYLVNLRPFYGDAANVVVTAYDINNSQKAINDYFTINIAADYPTYSRQSLRVEVPGRLSVLPFLDFVLYSESSISKDVSVPSGT